MITANEIYEFAASAAKACRECGYDDVARRLEDTMHLGSSGLEFLGAIKRVFIDHRAKLEQIVDKATLQEVIEYVNKAYGG